MQRKLLFKTVLWAGILSAGSAFAAPGVTTAAKPENNAGTVSRNFTTIVLTNDDPVAVTITGRVTDEANEPLPGVSVLEKGTTNATTTDTQGNFTIKVSGPNAVLVFKFIGYLSKEVPVGNQTKITLALTSENNALTEVVVTALGIKREAKKVGTSESKVDVQELNDNRTTNVMSSLEGQVAGLNIGTPTAGAGSSTRIRLRGQSGFNGVANSPLIVLNGLPFNQDASSANGNASQDFGDALAQINQDDIESMTVLKGAPAAALYGSRASNGAIIITTKSGAKNTSLGVEFASSFAADQALDYNNFQTVYGQGLGGKRPLTVGDAINGGGQNWGALNDGVPTIQFDGVLRPYTATSIHDRILAYYRTGTTFTNTLALSGGNQNTSFRMGFTNLDQNGITPYNNYHKKIFNLGVNSKINDQVTATFNLNYTHEYNDNPPQVGVQGIGSPNFLTRISNSIPLSILQQDAVDPTGGFERVISGFPTTLINPYYVQPRQFTLSKNDRFLGTATVRYNAAQYFYVQGRINFDYQATYGEGNVPSGVGSDTPTSSLRNSTNTGYNGSYYLNNANNTQLNMDFLMGTNNHTYGNFSAELTAGGNIYDANNRSASLNATDFVVQNLYTYANGVTKSASNGYSTTQTNSLYGVADFGFKNFLYLNVTDRTDWFSVLTPPTSLVANPKNYYNYYSASASFIFSELLPKATWLNFGKLRASYAQVGSASGVGYANSQLTYGLASQNYVAANGTSYPLGSIANGSDPNPYIQPFGVTEKEIGLEMRTLKSRVNFDIAFYDKTTDKQVISVPLSNTSGYGSVPLNLGKLQNQGVEIMLEVVPVRLQNFSWTSTFNSAYNTSKVLALAPGTSRYQVSSFSGNEFIGSLYYQVGMALNQLGARTYQRDANGNILLNSSGRLIQTTSDVLFGSADPKWTGGWSNTWRYKKLSLFAQIDYKLGNKILSSTALNGLRQGESQASLVGRVGGVVFPGVYAPGTPNAGQPNTTAVDPQTFYTDYRTDQIADPFIFNGGFFKLRNITLAYDVTSILGKKTLRVIKGLNISASCHNVLLIKKWIPDVDPEAYASSSDARLGYEQATLPTTRTYGLNLNVKL
jgi:TonB-linked SusC/RagA family outer membrane protein